MSRLKFVLSVLVLAVLFAAPPAAFAQLQPPGCEPISDKQVERLFDRWNDSLGTLNPDEVVANYAGNATLLPTVQNGPLVGHAAIRGYFVTFLADHPHGTINRRMIGHACNIAYDIGLYTFTYRNKPPTKARYTFVYEYQPSSETWLIVHHHSSKQPVATP